MPSYPISPNKLHVFFSFHTVLGSKAAKEGQFHDAAVYFSKAIQHYAFDIRWIIYIAACLNYVYSSC